MERKLLVRVMECPDGYELISQHHHDFVQHTDSEGRWFMLDGGTDYIRLGGDYELLKDISVYDDDPIDRIHKYYSVSGVRVNEMTLERLMQLRSRFRLNNPDIVDRIIEYKRSLEVTN